MNSVWLTVVGVVGFQILLFVLALRTARSGFPALLDGVLAESRRDLKNRAVRGEPPDWLRYLDDADRAVLPPRDRARILATAALAAAVGGTMLTLLIEVWVNPDLRNAIAGDASGVGGFEDLPRLVGAALVVSVSGVFNHLALLLVLIPHLERRAGSALDGFRTELQRAAIDSPPHQTFVDSVRSELATAFSDALQRFPEAFADFGRNVSGLRESSAALAAASGEVGPIAASLAASTEEFRAMPGELDRVLAEARQSWREEIRADQLRFLEELKEVLVNQKELLAETQRSLQDWETSRQKTQQDLELRIENLSADVSGAVDRLPGVFLEHANKAADTMGKSLGQQVANLVVGLERQVEVGNERQRVHFEENVKELTTTFLNLTGDAVRKAVGEVYEHDLFKVLEEIGHGLESATKKLPGQAESFARSLAVADEKLRLALAGIVEAGAHLERVAAATEGFELGLQEATVKSLTPLQRELTGFAAELRNAHRQMNDHTSGLVTFIEHLINRIAEGSRSE